MGYELERVNIFALHGFLGEGSDFDKLKISLPSNVNIFTVNLFENGHFSFESFDRLCVELCEHIQFIFQKTSGRNLFLGYSLGGRIGLHLLDRFPNLFEQYFFLSTHPGLNNESEKFLRKKNDEIWAEKIRNLNWNQFLKEWNSQLIFNNGGKEPQRDENNFNKNQLQMALKALSLSEQKNFNEIIQKYNDKLIWIVGDKDQKFLKIADELVQKKILKFYSRIFSGHRILAEANMNDLISIICPTLS